MKFYCNPLFFFELIVAQKKTNQKIFAFFFQSLVTIIHESFMGIYGHSCFRKAYF